MERKLRLFTGGRAILALGLGYALWVRFTGLAVPCPFFAVTGRLCPGCGVTRMCLALLRWDWAAAWDANPVLLMMLPFLAILGVRMAVRYIQETGVAGPKWENVLLWAMTVLLVIWGAARNFL